MRRRDLLKVAAAVPAAILAGCNGKEGKVESDAKKEKKCDPNASAKKPAGKCVLCKMCGEIKGSDKCCRKGAAKCTMCGLFKGSPGCCRIHKIAKETGKDVCLCTYCGEVKGSEKCCKEAPLCTMCGLHKGSPGCCRIKKEKMCTS